MYKIYQVEYGDTIDVIASKTNSTSDEIKKINGFLNDGDLVVGSLIIVPNNGRQMFNTYKVKSGDTIYSISKMYNTNPELLLLLNGLNKDDYIYPNQDILVPESNIDVYITKQGDTLDTILTNFNTSADVLNRENGRILLLSDQLLVHKKEENN